MRERLQTLPLAELKELAKAQGMKGISAMRKAELIELLCRQAEKKPEVKPTEIRQSEIKQPEMRQSEGRQPETRQPEARQPETRQQSEMREPRTERSDQPYTRQDNRGGDTRRPQRSYDRYGQPRNNYSRSYGNQNSYGGNSGGYSSGNYGGSNYNNYNNGNNNNNSGGSGYGSGNYSGGYNNSYGNNNGSSSNSSNGGYGNNSYNNNSNNGGSAAGSGNTAGSGSSPANAVAGSYGTSGISSESAERPVRSEAKNDAMGLTSQDLAELDSGIEANGILEVMPDGFGFIRCENFLPGDNDVYVAPSQIRRFNLKTGDIIAGNRRVKAATEKFAALLYIKTVNGYPLSSTETRPNFEDLTPIFPNQRLHMESPRESTSVSMRILDLLAPIGKGQRGMIVSPPKAGKTTLLKQVAKAITANHPEMHLMILLIDERPEEVTDIREAIAGPNVEVIYSTFDELPDRHKRVSEMVIERAKRLVEHGRDVIILLDSITRLARAYNLTVAPSGRTLSGGLDPAALHMPKRFFGAARNMREGGSLTILATALVDTGSRMDDVVYEEFKGTGNMELVLDRKLSEKRIFPAIDILKSGTRRDDLLLTKEEAEAVEIIHKNTNSLKPEEAVERILDTFARSRSNREVVEIVRKWRAY